MQKMAGPWIPVAGEVIDLLANENHASLKFYVVMLKECHLEQKEDTDTEWVGATIHLSERTIISKLGNSGHLRDKIFPRWEALGLLDRSDGKFYLPMYYKKGDAFLQPSRVLREMNSIRQVMGTMQKNHTTMEEKATTMEETIKNLVAIINKQQGVIQIPRAGHRREMHRSPVQNAPVTGAAVSLLSTKEKKISLSVREKIITIFYNGIGKDRITKREREKSLQVFQNLLDQDFTGYEIAFAVDWSITKGNIPVALRSFAVLDSVIGNAIHFLEEAQAREEHAQELLQEQEADLMTKEQEEELKEQIDGMKAGMTQAQRQELREEATEALMSIDGFNEDLISDLLIGIQENQILRQQIELEATNERSSEDVSV